MTDRVRRYYELVDANDVPGLVALFAPHATYHRPGYPPLVGRLDLTRFYEADRIIERGRHTLSSITADESSVAVRGDFRGRLKDGRDVELKFADFFTFDADLHFERRDTYFFAPLV
jgi:ketosteroid isomerase-like protein